jgi:hypothetical protein
MKRSDRCPECSGGGLVPALGCTCDGNAHTCPPAICRACGGSGIDKRDQAAGRVQRAAWLDDLADAMEQSEIPR